MALYALLDVATLRAKSFSFERFIARCESLDAALIQYRHKEGDDATRINDLRHLKSLTSIPIIVNDAIHLIDEADGVHLGQEDLNAIHPDRMCAALHVREKIGSKPFGLSTHNKEEITLANTLPLDYIGLGAYRATTTKQVENLLGDSLAQLAGYSTHPVAAIGGVTLNDKINNVTYYVIGTGLYED